MKVFTILLVLVLSGCVSTPRFKSAGIDKAYEILGVKIQSPNEPGWYLMQYNQFGLILGKDLSSKVKSVIANTNVYMFEGDHTDAEFLQNAMEMREKSSNPSRYKNPKVKNTLAKFKGNSCFSYETQSEDHKAFSKSKKPFQYFSTIGYFCRHPANKNIGVLMEVSYRDDIVGIPDEIKETAKEYFSNIELVNNKVR